ncbi:hypothetical protein Tco_0271573 [Tanacetum coccineum]
MESLSEVSAYLNELESMLDDEISTMMVEELVEVEKEAKVDDVMDIVVDTMENAKVKQEIMLYVRLDYGEYGRKVVKDIQVGVNGYDVEADFVVVDYVNEVKPSIMFGRSFLMTRKSQVDFGLGEMKINIAMLRENKDVDALLENLLKNMVEVNDASGEQVKIKKANRLKNYRVNKLTPPVPPKIEEIPKSSSTSSKPIFINYHLNKKRRF